jgi:hypothetical protein
VPALDLAVRLWVVRRGAHVGHAGEPNELLEVLGDELRAVVRDDARSFVGIGRAPRSRMAPRPGRPQARSTTRSGGWPRRARPAGRPRCSTSSTCPCGTDA